MSSPRATAPAASSCRPFDLHAVARPAGRFTGDFYLTAASREGLWIAIGDVAGKGLEAALVTSLAQEVLEPLMRCCCRPGELVRAVHEALLPELRPPHLFLTLVVGHVEPGGRLRLVNAGHFPPLLARPDGSVEEIPSHGPLVGVLPDPRWGGLDRRLAPGESLVLYSDGLLEATSPEGEELGMARLREAVSRRAGASRARDLADGLLREERRHRDGRPPHDDTTVLVLRR